MVVDGFGYVERDGRRLGLNCVILLSLVIIVCFRSIRWVLIPLAVMQLTLWMTRAVLVVSGFQLSMVSSMLTAIVTVIAVATTMHVILRYREARTDGLDQISAMKRAMAILFWPIFWACVTDATGFASLLIAEVGPVQDFGAMMAIASLLVLVSILLLVVPLELLGKFDADPKKAWGEGRMGIALQNSTKVIGRYPVLLAMVTTLGAVFVSAGNFFLEVETDFTKNFRKGTPIAVSYNFVEKRLGGAGVIDVILPAPKQLDNRYLKRVHQFEEEIRNLEFKSKNGERERALSKVISLADVLAATENAKGIGWLPLALRLQGMERLMPSLFASLYTKTPDKNGDYFYRVMLRASQRPSAKQKQWLVDEIQSAAERSFPVEENHQGPETTGFYILLSRLVQSILRDQYWSFALAIIGIALVMTISFRSIPLAAIAMVPNLLPILVVMGTLGWLGIKLNMGAAMIAAVSLGLSIDSSIHYLWSFQRWRASGLSVAESIVETQLQVGRAVIFSTLALVLGFSTLCLSEFVPTIYFGALVSATMLGGLFGNLVVLPVLLNLIYRKRKTTDAIND
jgi:predicted RND superfamily exporter protein